jgi:hypothetical protein
VGWIVWWHGICRSCKNNSATVSSNTYSLCPIDLETLGLFDNSVVNNCRTKKIVVHPYPNSTISYLLAYDLNIDLASYKIEKRESHVKILGTVF